VHGGGGGWVVSAGVSAHAAEVIAVIVTLVAPRAVSITETSSRSHCGASTGAIHTINDSNGAKAERRLISDKQLLDEEKGDQKTRQADGESSDSAGKAVVAWGVNILMEELGRVRKSEHGERNGQDGEGSAHVAGDLVPFKDM